MRVLVGCEYSGVVRDAFIAKGHEAMSCDLLPTDKPGPHYQGSVLDLLDEKFDLAIFHPPCTYLCSSGLHWNGRTPGRQALTDEALEFVKRLLASNIPRIALENPIGCISTKLRKPDQIIQPHQFGHPESKATCLWLKGLPKLVPTNVLPKPESGRWDNQTASGQNKLGPSEDRWKIRSTTYRGIAEAFAAQWGGCQRPNTEELKMRKPTRIPKPIRLDNLQHVQLGMAKADTGGGEIQTIRIKNHMALRSLELGEASSLDIEMLIVAANIAKGLAKQGLQTEWSREIVAGQQALDTVKVTGDVTPNNLQAVQLALMIHDKQLDVATVIQLERSLTKRS